MAPAMKSAMKSQGHEDRCQAMTKAQLADQLATKSELKKKDVLSVLQNLSDIGASEVTNTGKVPCLHLSFCRWMLDALLSSPLYLRFVLPGLCMIKTRAWVDSIMSFTAGSWLQ